MVPGSVELIKENGHGDGRLQTVLVGIDSGVMLAVVEMVVVGRGCVWGGSSLVQFR